MRKKFKATIQAGGGGGAFVEVPFDAKVAFGSARAKVAVTFDGMPYRGTIAAMRGTYLIGVLKEIRNQLGKDIGDVVQVTVELDSAPRAVALPDDAEVALRAAGALAAFKKLSYTHQKEHVNAIEEARKPETRQRRIKNMVEDLLRRS